MQVQFYSHIMDRSLLNSCSEFMDFIYTPTEELPDTKCEWKRAIYPQPQIFQCLQNLEMKYCFIWKSYWSMKRKGELSRRRTIGKRNQGGECVVVASLRER